MVDQLKDYYLMNAETTQGVDRRGNIVDFTQNVSNVGGVQTPEVKPTGQQVVQLEGGGTKVTGYQANQEVLINGVRYIFDGTKLVPIMTPPPPQRQDNLNVNQNNNAPQLQTIPDPVEVVPGSDAMMPVDRYMDTLGVNTLAGQAYSDALARRLASIEDQQLAAGQTYQDMYEQAKMSQAARRGLSDTSGFAGGMAEQYGAQMSAAEMGALGQIGVSREATMRQLETERIAAPMAAFQEAQTVDEYQRAIDQLEFQNAIAMNEELRRQGQYELAMLTAVSDQERQAIQDAISMEGIASSQRAETLAEMQYWQGVLADVTQTALHEEARQNLSTLGTRYAQLLTGSRLSDPNVNVDNNQNVTTGFTKQTGLTTRKSGETFIEARLENLGFTDDMALPNFETRIQSMSDLAPLLYDLAGDKAKEGYDFTEELSIINRAVNAPQDLLPDEFERLKEAGIYKDGVRYADALGLLNGVDDQGQNTHLYPISPRTQEFVAWLLDKGELTEAQLETAIQGNNYNLSTLYFDDYQEFLETR